MHVFLKWFYYSYKVNMQYNTYDFEVAEKSSSARSYATSNHQVKQDKDLSRDSVGLSLR